MSYLIVRYFHFIGILAMLSMLTIEHLFLKRRIENHWLKRMAVFDAIYGAAAAVTLLCGVILWFWVGKPAEFYSSNWVFHTKVTLFVLTGILSSAPTRFILKNRKNPAEVIEVPKHITMVIRVEMLLLCTIPLLAVLMAHGVGHI